MFVLIRARPPHLIHYAISDILEFRYFCSLVYTPSYPPVSIKYTSGERRAPGSTRTRTHSESGHSAQTRRSSPLLAPLQRL